MSGSFDENAVDYFFGEIARPDSTKIVSPPVSKISNDGTEIPFNKNLIFILSTNSKEVADQIGNFASNEETLKQIALLSKSDVILEKGILEKEIEFINKEKSDYLKIGDEFIVGINSEDFAQSKQLLLIYINFIASLRGENLIFNNIQEAKNWLQNEF